MQTIYCLRMSKDGQTVVQDYTDECVAYDMMLQAREQGCVVSMSIINIPCVSDDCPDSYVEYKGVIL